jgi:hypothetical protein
MPNQFTILYAARFKPRAAQLTTASHTEFLTRPLLRTLMAIEGNSYRPRKHVDLVPEDLPGRRLPNVIDPREPKTPPPPPAEGDCLIQFRPITGTKRAGKSTSTLLGQSWATLTTFGVV